MSVPLWPRICELWQSRPRLPARFHIAFGLSSLVTSGILLAVFLGFVPDRQGAIDQGRIALSEALASSTSRLLERGDLTGIRSNLEFVVERNAMLTTVVLHRTNTDSSVHFGDEVVASEISDVRVPLYRGGREWGELQFHFSEVSNPGWVDRLRASPFGLMVFLSVFCFPAFYFYLGKMLKELNPSEAVPARVRNALDTIAEALIVIDRRGDIVLANAAFAALNGESAESLVGINAESLAWVSESAATHCYPWQGALNSGEASRNTMIGFTDDKQEVRKFLVNCSPITGTKGHVGGVLISMDDVTLLEEKEMLLRQSMLAAEEANHAKSAFLSNMSHEIRTPMTAILGFTEILKRGFNLSTEERTRHLGTISNSGQHLLELINDVLDLSKVESGAMDVESIETSIATTAYEVTKVLRVKALEKGITLSLTIDTDLPEYIWSDPSRVRQILTNLVGNAIKFTESGGVKVALAHDAHTQCINLSVTDSGIGMTETQLSGIFDAFTQADSSITRRFGGTGLGLSISRKLAEALGGDITVCSEAGKGSTFTVQLTTGDVSDVPVLSPEACYALFDTVSGSVVEQWVFPSARVLVADDAQENRELLSIVLEDLGLSVILADDGLAALELTQQKTFDVVLMDIQMPVMDGYEAVTAMRQAQFDKPVVALTANAMKGYERKILDSGFSHYQTKPIDLDKLTQLLAEILGGTLKQDRVHKQRSSLPETDVDNSLTMPIYSSLATGNERFVAIVDRFLKKLPDELADMRKALENADWSTLANLAHWLKGSGGTVGFDALYEPALAMEKAAKASDGATAADLMTELDRLTNRFRSCKDISEDKKSAVALCVTNTDSQLSNSDQQVDTPVTSSLLEQNPRFFSIVERFVERLAARISDLELAFEEDDLASVADFAHWLKGSGGNVGYENFTALGEELEECTVMSDRQKIRSVIDAIEHYADRVSRGWQQSLIASKSA